MLDTLLTILTLLVIGGWVYWFVAWYAVTRFMRRGPTPAPEHRPPLSVLKPVKGVDAEIHHNLRSLCAQAYPRFEVLCGVRDPDDPVIPVLHQLQNEFPHREIRIIVDQPPGSNHKSAMLDRLSREARYPALVIADSDIRVGPDYLHTLAAALGAGSEPVVTSLYRSRPSRRLTSRMEALYLDTSFLPAAIVGFLCGGRYVFGATIAVRRDQLLGCGGYQAIRDHLSDDYRIGQRLADGGAPIQLTDGLVDNIIGSSTPREQWDREIRWARGIRTNCPAGYAGLVFTLSVPMALVLAGCSGFSPWGLWVLAATLVQRYAVGWFILGAIGRSRADLPFLPARDLLTALVWVAGMFGSKVTWRGESFHLDHIGQLHAHPPRLSSPWAWPIRLLDHAIRRRAGIFEYSQDPEVILRLELRQLKKPVTLTDGGTLPEGAWIGEVHLWNNHMPRIPRGGPNLAWATGMRRRMERSLEELAAYLDQDPRGRTVAAVGGRMALDADTRYRSSHIAEKMGFERVPIPRRRWYQALHDAGEDLLLMALVTVYNPWGRKPGILRRKRAELWMPRRKLLRMYGPDPGAPRRRAPAPQRPTPAKGTATSPDVVTEPTILRPDREAL